MSFNWIKYSKKDDTLVREFVTCNFGSFFHEPSFFEYHAKDRFDFSCYICKKGDKIVSWLPGHKENNTFFSPAGASYGGPLWANSVSLEEQLLILKNLIKFLKTSNFTEVNLVTPPPIYFGDNGFIMSALGFNYSKRLCCHILHLAAGSWPESMSKSKRYDFRKTKSNDLNFEELNESEFPYFYSLLQKQNYKLNSKTTHSLEEILKLNSLLPGRIKLYATKSNNNILAATLIFLINKKIAYTFYIVNSDSECKQGYVTHLLVHTSELLRKKGFHWLDLGPSSFDKFTLNNGLASFKKSLGAILMTRDEWSIKLSN